VYVRKVNDADGPLKTLGLPRVDVAAERSFKRRLLFLPVLLSSSTRSKGAMTIASGTYELWYGSSSATKDLKMAKVDIH